MPEREGRPRAERVESAVLEDGVDGFRLVVVSPLLVVMILLLLLLLLSSSMLASPKSHLVDLLWRVMEMWRKFCKS